MKVTKWLFVLCILLSTSTAQARFRKSDLEIARRSNSTTYAPGVKALIEVIDLPLRQNILRPKLPGQWSTFFEAGYRISDVYERDLAPFTTDSNPSSIANSFMGKVGIGLPFGFNIAAGVSQSLIEEKLTGLNASLSYQLLDFSSLLYSDYVPAVSIEASVLRNLSEIGFYTFSSSITTGVYDRMSMVQFGYALTYQYSLLTVLNPAISRWFMNHTLVSQVPIAKSFFLRSEIGLPHLSGTFLLGYDF